MLRVTLQQEQEQEREHANAQAQREAMTPVTPALTRWRAEAVC